jgi:hypothetical protein
MKAKAASGHFLRPLAAFHISRTLFENLATPERAGVAEF